MSDVQLSITGDAINTITVMSRRVGEIEQQYGRGSAEHVDAMESMMRALMGLLVIGGRISKDGELSLLSVGWLVMGTIWHPKYIDGNTRDPLLGTWSQHT